MLQLLFDIFPDLNNSDRALGLLYRLYNIVSIRNFVTDLTAED